MQKLYAPGASIQGVWPRHLAPVPRELWAQYIRPWPEGAKSLDTSRFDSLRAPCSCTRSWLSAACLSECTLLLEHLMVFTFTITPSYLPKVVYFRHPKPL